MILLLGAFYFLKKIYCNSQHFCYHLCYNYIKEKKELFYTKNNNTYNQLINDIDNSIMQFKNDNNDIKFSVTLLVGIWNYNDSRTWELFVNVIAYIENGSKPFIKMPVIIDDKKINECKVDDYFFDNIIELQKKGKKLNKYLQKHYKDTYCVETHNLTTKIKKSNVKNF